MTYAHPTDVATLLGIQPRGMFQLTPHVAMVSRRSFGGQL